MYVCTFKRMYSSPLYKCNKMVWTKPQPSPSSSLSLEEVIASCIATESSGASGLGRTASATVSERAGVDRTTARLALRLSNNNEAAAVASLDQRLRQEMYRQ